jgi:putative polyketide hydroxylase
VRGTDGPTGTQAAAPAEISPELPTLIAQDTLEPLLRAAAVAAGATVRFGTELTGFSPERAGVRAELAGPGGGRLQARYLVAADGARSPVRETLGITRSGRGDTGGPMVNVYFRADLAEVVRGREFNLCQIEHPDAPGGLASVDGRYRWVFMSPGGAGRDWPAVLRTALGVPAPELEVLSVLEWRGEMRVADRYRAGPVFLAGDAAHVMPPFAASGANTGIADGHNLAWKLAAALRGEAADALLDSYQAERRPAGWFAADQSARRTGDLRSGAVPGDGLAHPYVLAAGGFQYPAGALAGDPAADPEPVTEFRPAGRVGTRVPHRWLDQARSRSTLDLAGPGWAVLQGGPGRDFLPAGQALLLRPDHIVAWRGPGPVAASRVRGALLRGESGLSAVGVG